MNLEKLNLVELDSKEMKQVDGGIAPILVGAIIKGIGTGFAVASAIYGAVLLGKQIAD